MPGDPSHDAPERDPSRPQAERDVRRADPLPFIRPFVHWSAPRPRTPVPVPAAPPGSVVVEPPPAAVPATPSVVQRPFALWSRYPWAVVWSTVVLSPVAVLALRAVDDAGHEGLVTPLAWTFVALFTVALLVALVTRGPRAPGRVTAGLAGAVAVAGLLLWPTMQVTLGPTACPARAGEDIGVDVSMGAIDAWRRRAADGWLWKPGPARAGWSERGRLLTLDDYTLTGSGCWERMAPVSTERTWHEYRVTVRHGERGALSKIVLVHTVREGDGWKIESIEGPLP